MHCVPVHPEIIITTTRRPDGAEIGQARELARETGFPLVMRENYPLANILALHGAGFALLAEKKGLLLTDGQRELFFHPSLSLLRISRIKKGETDRMTEAMQLWPGDKVLDCTLGLGADAIVAAYATGPRGRVTGLEIVAVLALLVRRGLLSYPAPDEIGEAMRRINVLTGDYRHFLPQMAAASYDVVYFDPMFKNPLTRSPAIGSLRALADPTPLDIMAVQEALRVAGKRVVIKERRGSDEFARLGCTRVVGGKYAPVAYGIIEKTGGYHV